MYNNDYQTNPMCNLAVGTKQSRVLGQCIYSGHKVGMNVGTCRQ